MEKKPVSEFLSGNVNLFLCPICSEEFVLNGNSLVCINKHCFDIAKNGYVNFLLKQGKTQYSLEMFEARKYVNQKGFFKPLTDEIKNLTGSTNDKVILDLGCGEGSHMLEMFDEKSVNIGLDISKDAVKFAQGKNNKRLNTIFCVADIARLPIKSQSADIVTNIFSPYNADELHRVLKPSGTIIKAVPGADYLIELRKELFKNTEKENYSNESIVNHFSNNFTVNKIVRINYKVPTDSEYVNQILIMSPLSFHIEHINIKEKNLQSISSITVDILLLFT